MDKMNILLSVNDTYVFPSRVLITSIAENNKTEQVVIYLFYHDLSQAGRNLIEKTAVETGNVTVNFVFIEKQLFSNMPMKAEMNPYITIETYYRLAISEKLPDNIDRILYLDTDMVVNGSLKELYSLPFQGNMAIVCEDLGLRLNRKARKKVYENLGFDNADRYFNAGMLLINADLFRQNYSLNAFQRFISEYYEKLIFHDQDVLNYLWKNSVQYTDYNKYNARPFYYPYTRKSESILNNAVIIHYGEKPWQPAFTDLGGMIYGKYALQVDGGQNYKKISESNDVYRKSNYLRIQFNRIKRNAVFMIKNKFGY